MNDETLLLRWLESKETNGASANTLKQYQLHVSRFIAWCRRQGLSPLDPGQDALEVFSGAYLHKELGISARSRRPVIAALKGWFRYLHDYNIIASRPDKLLRYPKAGKPLPVAMSLQAAEMLMWAPDLSQFTGVRDAAILSLLIGCGIRVAGLVGMNESDLHFSHDGERESLSITVIEKGNKQRMLPAPDEARLLVRAYLGHPDLDKTDRTLANGDRVLFINLRNGYVASHNHNGESRRLSDWAVRNMIKRYGKQAGIDPSILHPHAARHLYGTEMAEDDTDLIIRQMLLGHSSPTSTAIYTQLAQRKLRGVVDRANPLGKIRTPVSDLVAHLR